MIKYIIIHCSATYPDQYVDADTIRKWHVEENGWSDIGYHWIINRNGLLEKGREEDVQGAHTYGYNKNSIGVCIIGGLSKGDRQACNFTAAQWHSLDTLLHDLTERYPDAEVMGHNDVSDKDCPTFDVKAYWGV